MKRASCDSMGSSSLLQGPRFPLRGHRFPLQALSLMGAPLQNTFWTLPSPGLEGPRRHSVGRTLGQKPEWTQPFWGEQTAGGHPKALPRPRQPLLAVPALRELESASRVSL